VVLETPPLIHEHGVQLKNINRTLYTDKISGFQQTQTAELLRVARKTWYETSIVNLNLGHLASAAWRVIHIKLQDTNRRARFNEKTWESVTFTSLSHGESIFSRVFENHALGKWRLESIIYVKAVPCRDNNMA